MSVNAVFSTTSFNPTTNALFRTLRPDVVKPHAPQIASAVAAATSVHSPNSGKEQILDVDDDLSDQVGELLAKNAALETEVDELYEVMEQMHQHIEALEAHQHSLVAYVNKVCNDVKNIKRRGVWQKIEYDKERQQLVEELYTWKQKAQEAKNNEKEAVTAVEATAAWEAACLNQTIEQLQGELLTVKTELSETQEELSRRGGSAEEAAETEQMLEALQELALDLKTQLDQSAAELELEKAKSAREIEELRDTVSELKQRSIKDSMAHDKEREELVEELLMWKHRALDASTVDTSQSEIETTATASSSSTEDENETKQDDVRSHQGDEKSDLSVGAPAEPSLEAWQPIGVQDDVSLGVAVEASTEDVETEVVEVKSTKNGDDATSDGASPTIVGSTEFKRAVEPVDSSFVERSENFKTEEELRGDNQRESEVHVVPTLVAEELVPIPEDNQREDDDEEDAGNAEIVEVNVPTECEYDAGSAPQTQDNQVDDVARVTKAPEKKVTDSLEEDDTASLAYDSRDPSEFGDDDSNADSVTLLTPQHSESFFSRLRSFSYRSRTDSMSSLGSKDHPATPSEQTTAPPKVKVPTPRAKPLVTPNTQNDYMRQQERHRMGSFKQFY